MELKLQNSLKNLENQDLEGVTVGKAIANILLAVKSDPLRAYLMAQKLYQDDTMEFSKADFEWVKSCVKDNGKDVYNVLIVGQLLAIFSEMKEDK